MKDAKDKTNDELIEITNKAIAELVYPKWDLLKAYNYYNGIRDAELFRYLEENYGIGNPTSIEFVPLIKKHIDALVGEYLGNAIIPKVSCKDSDTISKVTREKELKITAEVLLYLTKKLRNRLMLYLQTNKDDAFLDTSVKLEIEKLIDNVDNNFISLYEIAALNVILYLIQSRDVDIHTKLKTILLDLLISGWTFFRAVPSAKKNNVIIEALSPLNTFIDKNPESPYIKDSYRAVVRKWLTKTQILNMYGKEMTKEDRETIKELWRDLFDTSYYYVRSFSNADGTPATDGISAGREVVPGYPAGPYNTYNYKLIPVYEVEWIETDDNFIMLRYSTVRIGESIYILKGKDENVVRSLDNPSYCSLTLNGIYFVNRNAEPFSLMLSCISLLDKYDLLCFYRDNLIASSGSVGDWIDVSMIPSFLGVNLPERLQKWKAYKKAGAALIDTSLEGRLGSGQAPVNTIFNGYDDTIKAQAIQAILMAIDSVEATVSSITGVFRERLNGIELRDAVTNVKIGANNSFTITKQYYLLMDLVTREILLDALNVAKIVYKKGLTGTLILGDRQLKVFTALPEYFTVSDFDIHLTTTTDTLKEMEYIKLVIPEFIKANALEPSIIFEAITAKSMTELKLKVKKALALLKEENNQLLNLSLLVEQLTTQLLLAEKLLSKYENLNNLLELAKMQLEQLKLLLSNELEWYKARTDRQYREATAAELRRRTEIEIQLLYDGNPYNDKLRQV